MYLITIKEARKELEQEIQKLTRALESLTKVNSLSDGTHVKPSEAKDTVGVCLACYRRLNKREKLCYCDYEEARGEYND